MPLSLKETNGSSQIEVLQALDLKPGNVALDLGCGSGYFTLKLSDPVGPSGKVLAEDIRRLPLAFLWVRTVQRGKGQRKHFSGEPSDPRMAEKSMNAVLIANTYHEFTDSHSIVSHLFNSLISGGRLVVLDREPLPAGAGPVRAGVEDHEVSANEVENQLRQGGFEIVGRQDRFIEDDPIHETWWLITARKP